MNKGKEIIIVFVFLIVLLIIGFLGVVAQGADDAGIGGGVGAGGETSSQEVQPNQEKDISSYFPGLEGKSSLETGDKYSATIKSEPLGEEQEGNKVTISGLGGFTPTINGHEYSGLDKEAKNTLSFDSKTGNLIDGTNYRVGETEAGEGQTAEGVTHKIGNQDVTLNNGDEVKINSESDEIKENQVNIKIKEGNNLIAPKKADIKQGEESSSEYKFRYEAMGKGSKLEIDGRKIDIEQGSVLRFKDKEGSKPGDEAQAFLKVGDKDSATIDNMEAKSIYHESLKSMNPDEEINLYFNKEDYGNSKDGVYFGENEFGAKYSKDSLMPYKFSPEKGNSYGLDIKEGDNFNFYVRNGEVSIKDGVISMTKSEAGYGDGSQLEFNNGAASLSGGNTVGADGKVTEEKTELRLIRDSPGEAKKGSPDFELKVLNQDGSSALGDEKGPQKLIFSEGKDGKMEFATVPFDSEFPKSKIQTQEGDVPINELDKIAKEEDSRVTGNLPPGGTKGEELGQGVKDPLTVPPTTPTPQPAPEPAPTPSIPKWSKNQDLQTIADLTKKYNGIHVLGSELSKSKIAVYDFGASWCGPCQKLKPFIEGLAKRGDITVVTIDIDSNRALAQKLGVSSLPSVFYVNPKNGDIFGGKPEIGFHDPNSKIDQYLK